MSERDASWLVRRAANVWLCENHDGVAKKKALSMADHVALKRFVSDNVDGVHAYAPADGIVHDFRQWLKSEFFAYEQANE